MFNCPHTGVALAALLKLLHRGVIRKNERVVVISTAHGLKFAEMKISYHQSQLAGFESRYANRPIELPNDPALVRDTIRRCIDLNADHKASGSVNGAATGTVR
jgi:threonine synthase